MESVDPINEYFIKFKYDLKFSSVNRREYRSRLEANIVREELLEINPYIHELFEVQKDLSSLYDLDKSGSKKLGSIGSFDNKSKETTSSRQKFGAHNKTRSIDSTSDQRALNAGS